MEKTKIYFQSDAESYLNRFLVDNVKDVLEFENLEEATQEFTEKNFAEIFSVYKPEPTPLKRDKYGRLKYVAYRHYRKSRWVIHNDDLKFRLSLLTTLGPISLIFFQQWAIPTQILSLAVILINYFANAKKKGATLTEDQFSVFLTLKLLEKETKNSVAIKSLLETVNKERVAQSKTKFTQKKMKEILDELADIRLNDGTTSKFVDTDKKGNCWCVDV